MSHQRLAEVSVWICSRSWESSHTRGTHTRPDYNCSRSARPRALPAGLSIFLAAHRSRLSRSRIWLAGRAIRLAAAEPTIASRPRARDGVVGGPRSRRSRPLVSRFLLTAAQRTVALGQQAVPGKEGLVEPGMSRTGQKVVGEFCNVFRRSRSRRRVWAVRFCGPYCGPA